MAGTLLLCLPAASATGRSVGLLGAAFTATSAVCVTGLNIVDIGLGYSTLGHVIIIALIQMGGLGFMIFATLGMVALGRRISLRSRVLIRDSMNQSSLSGLIRLTKWTTALVIAIEGLGACLLMIRFIPEYGVGKGIWFSFFHSISAFCNAGFDLLGNFTSVVPLQNDPLIIATLTGNPIACNTAKLHDTCINTIYRSLVKDGSISQYLLRYHSSCNYRQGKSS
jgi:trk system potassium uptake protein TrkH